ncbi:MAG: penicillin acylase family protein, partial [Blastocatellia bacterium]
MKKTALFILIISIVFPFSALSARKTQPDNVATVYRDEYGIPHVFAKNLEAAAYAIGYAQAEDRLEELLKNYRRAEGTMSEVFGPSYLQTDLIQRMVRHEEISREKYNEVSPKSRAVIEAFQAGIKAFEKEHPDQVPSWGQQIHPWDVVALGRYIIYGWPLGEAIGDLQRAGIHLTPPSPRASNEVLIAPSRTAMHAPIAIVDPHLSWYDEFRFYEERIYAGDFDVSGVAILGIPIPSLGHSRFCSVAMTTGGPDTSDIFEEEVNPENPHQYRLDGKWLDMQVRKFKVGVKKDDHVDQQEIEVDYTRHGPIVARKENKAYAMAIPYAEEVGLTDQGIEMMSAHNLTEMKQALSHLQLMAQNIMVGTVQGDIYYVRNGRVPIRPDGVDSHLPIPGNTSKNDWQGIHPFSDLVQLTNPSSGYMHNCNVTPAGMMKDSPLTDDKYTAHPYLYNATNDSPRHQRAYEMTDALDAANHVTLDQAMDIAFNTTVWHAELWQARLKSAWEKDPGSSKAGETSEVYNLIENWNRRSDEDSEGALAYYAFKKALDPRVAYATDPPGSLKDEQLVEAVQKGSVWLKDQFGSVHTPFGKYFRVGRKGGDQT